MISKILLTCIHGLAAAIVEQHQVRMEADLLDVPIDEATLAAFHDALTDVGIQPSDSHPCLWKGARGWTEQGDALYGSYLAASLIESDRYATLHGIKPTFCRKTDMWIWSSSDFNRGGTQLDFLEDDLFDAIIGPYMQDHGMIGSIRRRSYYTPQEAWLAFHEGHRLWQESLASSKIRSEF